MTIEEVVGTRGRISKIEKVRDAVRVVNKTLAIAHGVHETGRKGDPLRRCRRTIGSCHHRLRIDLTRVTGRGVSRMAAATLGYGAVNEAAGPSAMLTAAGAPPAPARDSDCYDTAEIHA